MNQMLLQNVSVLHYPDSLTTCNPPEVPSPDLAADAVQTCWRHKALLSEWLTGTRRTQKEDESITKQTVSGMTQTDSTITQEHSGSRLTKKWLNQTYPCATVLVDKWAKEHSRWPIFQSNVIRRNLALNGNTTVGGAELRSHLVWTETS